MPPLWDSSRVGRKKGSMIFQAQTNSQPFRGVACVADSCKHPCTQSAQRLQFTFSNFHENKKPFLIGHFGLVWYAPFDWLKIMITLQSRGYNKNKRNLISRSDGEADLLTWCLLFLSDSPFYCNACSVHLERDHWQKSRRKGDKTVQENTLESR